MKIKMYEKANVIDFNGNIVEYLAKVDFLNTTELKKHLSSDKPLLKSHRLCDKIECQPGACFVGLVANELTCWTRFANNFITIDQFKKDLE